MSKVGSFSAKVLLFGEYSVIKNSMALSIPYSLFEGKLRFNPEQRGKDPELQALARYLKKLDSDDTLGFPMDISSFEFDIGQGLIFDSTIPQGYGVGSSGALCAALYDRYVEKRSSNLASTNELKKRFSVLESHFHGASSGLDPLISYLDRPILIDQNSEHHPVQIPESLNSYSNGSGAIFLLNTGRSRKTEPLVNLFLEKCKSEEFNEQCMNKILPVTNECITHFLEGRLSELEAHFSALSSLQYEYFLPMIPKFFRDVWKQGLDSNKYLLKLCGAGGGGFLLGWCRDFKEVSKLLEDHEIRSLYRF